MSTEDVALAVDLGGTKVEAALVTASGVLVAGSRARRSTGPASTLDTLGAAVTQVVAEALAALPAGTALLGAGIGSAGPLDLATGTTAPLNLPGAAGFAIRDTVRTAADGAPTTLALDGLCITLAEQWVGAARGIQNVMGMVVSTGIGGGLILGGRIVLGGTGNAGHIGQVAAAGFTPEGTTGVEVTGEHVASGPNIVRWAVEHGWSGSTGEELARDYAAGVEVAVAAVRRSAAAVGSIIASATALCDIDVAVIGGGFSHVSPAYLDLVRAARDEVAPFPFTARARIVPAALGSDAPLVGAAALVFREL